MTLWTTFLLGVRCHFSQYSYLWQGYDTPLVADIHFQPQIAMDVAEAFEKIRINPGNFVDGRKTFDEYVYDSKVGHVTRVHTCRRGKRYFTSTLTLGHADSRIYRLTSLGVDENMYCVSTRHLTTSVVESCLHCTVCGMYGYC